MRAGATMAAGGAATSTRRAGGALGACGPGEKPHPVADPHPARRAEGAGDFPASQLDGVEQARIVDGSLAEIHPVLPEAAGNDVVDRGRVVIADVSVQVAMSHCTPPLAFPAHMPVSGERRKPARCACTEKEKKGAGRGPSEPAAGGGLARQNPLGLVAR